MIRQKKQLSQIFLKESWPCIAVVDFLKAQSVEHVLEIGPGSGQLTKILLENNLKVTAVEKDERYADLLQQSIDNPNFTVINQDILKFNIKEWIGSSSQSKAICGNIPYHISTPILTSMFAWLKLIKCSCLLVQLEFAERLVAKENIKSYGSLSVYAQLRSEVTLEHVVDKTCFTPVPKIDSALVSFLPKRNKEDLEILKKVEKLSKLAFSQRRKKLKNSIKPLLNEKLIENCPIDLSRRCETLSPEEFVQLAKIVFDIA
jgi:16S rRNA (adenine1518-N6/adenine1519-N6)-dimethyltransferase|tara:strand:+ start:289 stop:1068 length:780 start_codon:yes stop_codon:yes gene_type:complete